ncbi:MAG TPA: glycosyltransferase family 39 protein [Anaerolineales bacterium]|nr:glycosyltransferase family 39 protein [Anaerolineales bacterium]
MRRGGIGLAVALGAGLVLRLIGLASRPIWYDDAFSLLLSRRSLVEIVRGTAADTMPPLYYFMLHAWGAVANSIAGIRLLNLVLSLAIIAMAYAIASALFDRKAALIAALLTAISPLQIYQAQEVRMYVLLCLSLAVYVWALVVAWRGAARPAWWPWAAAVAAGTAAMYTHNLAVFSLIAPAVYFAASRKWDFLKKLSAALGTILVLSGPWLLYLPGQIAKIQAAFWTPKPGLLEVIQALAFLHGFLPLPTISQAALVALSLIAVAFTLLTVWRGDRPAETAFLLAWMIVPPAALFAVSYVMRPVFVPRAFMLSGVAYLILAGRAITAARVLPVRIVLAGCFLGAAALSLPSQYGYRAFPRSAFPEASAYLEEQADPSDAVVHDNKLSFFPMYAYAPGIEQRFLPDEPGSHNDTLAPATEAALGLFPSASLEAATQGAERVFFIVFDRAIEEYRSMGLEDHPRLTWLRLHFVDGGFTSFGDLRVYDFER